MLVATWGKKAHLDIFEACRYNKLWIVEKIIKKNQDQVNRKSLDGGWSGLMEAVNSNNTLVASEVLSTPVLNLSIQDDRGFTALHFCCINNRIECLKLLLLHPQCNKDFIEIKDDDGWTAAMWAKRCEFKDCELIIKKYINTYEALYITTSTSPEDWPGLSTSTDNIRDEFRNEVKNLGLAELKKALRETNQDLKSYEEELKNIKIKQEEEIDNHKKIFKYFLDDYQQKEKEMKRDHVDQL